MSRRGDIVALQTRVQELALEVRGERAPAAQQPMNTKPPERLAASTLMLAIPGIGEILREHFVEVPERFFERRGREVLMHCPCERDLVLAFGSLTHCTGCLRFYFNGNVVRATKPPAPDELFVCDGCGEDLPAGEGTWALVAGRELFVCQDCLRDVPEETDLLSEPELAEAA